MLGRDEAHVGHGATIRDVTLLTEIVAVGVLI